MKLPTEARRFFKMCVIGITPHLDLKCLFSEATFLSALWHGDHADCSPKTLLKMYPSVSLSAF